MIHTAHFWHTSRPYRRVRDVVQYVRAVHANYSGMQVMPANTAEQVAAAKKLHASVYVRRRFFNKADCNNLGIITKKADPYQTHADYFVVQQQKTGEVITVARQIRAKRGLGFASLPLTSQVQLYERARRRIMALNPQDCVEISALAKKSGVGSIAPLLMYRYMWHHSLRNKHAAWLLTCDQQLFIRLRLLFGPAIQRVGSTTLFPGGYVVPAVLNIQSSVTALQKSVESAPFLMRIARRSLARFLIHGLPEGYLSARELRALRRLKKQLRVA